MRQSTNCKYNYYIKRWLAYSETMRKIEVTHVLDFLSAMFEKGHAYSTINSVKCAIATTVHIPPCNSLNKHPMINKYMTGIFETTKTQTNPTHTLSTDASLLGWCASFENRRAIQSEGVKTTHQYFRT